MKIIAERIIQVLKADTALVALIGNKKNVFAKTLNETDKRPQAYVTVEASPGEDMNYVDAQNDDIDIEVGVSRKGANSYKQIMDIVARVDAVLNKKENTLSNSTWKILNFVRSDCPTRGVLIDDRFNEYYIVIRYSYILSE